MKCLLWISLCVWASFCNAQGQRTSEALIESRQSEVVRLAPLYFIDLSRGDWKHVPIDPCPAFTRHGFARYERSPAPGVISSFIAIYPLNLSKAKVDRPWKTGILLIPTETFAREHPSVAERQSTILIFNQIWADELKAGGHPSQFPALEWGGLADCYAALTGWQPVPPQSAAPGTQPASSIDLKTNPASSVLIPVTGNGGNPETFRLALDARGMVTEASVK